MERDSSNSDCKKLVHNYLFLEHCISHQKKKVLRRGTEERKNELGSFQYAMKEYCSSLNGGRAKEKSGREWGRGRGNGE